MRVIWFANYKRLRHNVTTSLFTETLTRVIYSHYFDNIVYWEHRNLIISYEISPKFTLTNRKFAIIFFLTKSFLNPTLSVQIYLRTFDASWHLRFLKINLIKARLQAFWNLPKVARTNNLIVITNKLLVITD